MSVTSKAMTDIKIKLLKEMHNYIIEIGDEEIYMTWILTIPDEPTDDDFEWIADNDDEWIHVCKLFGKLVKYDIEENYNHDNEPAGIDDDCGFDPYMGEYTYDC